MARRHEAGGAPELVLIVGAARSGTTLLRKLLDTHPEIGAPGEAGVPAWLAHSVRVWGIVTAPQAARSTQSTLSATAEASVRDTVVALMRAYCEPAGKRLYCDKSLDSHDYLDVVRHYFPDVKVVIVARHVMDTIASGLEASPFGFNAFGYLPFVSANPGNFVAALAAYWERQVSAALRWEQDHPQQCIRVTYESLVTDPRSVLQRVFSFLGVRADVDVETALFASTRRDDGPGDFKITYTDAISDKSVGRGRRVPVALIPDPLLRGLNELLLELGYPVVDRTWNAAPASTRVASAEATVELTRVMSRTGISVDPWPTDLDTFAVVAVDDPESRWTIRPRTGEIVCGDGEVDFVITAACDDLLVWLRGEENAGTLLQSGRLRWVAPPATEGGPHRDHVQAVAAINEWVARWRAQSASVMSASQVISAGDGSKAGPLLGRVAV